MASSKQSNWLPEIVYEEMEGGGSSKIPFIHVPDDVEDPPLLFIFLTRKTGEVEPGPEGEEVPVVDMTLHQFVDMQRLQEKLTPDVFDQVRAAVGLEPRADAARKGKGITSNIRARVESSQAE
jgi:hypothetical protein